MTGGLFIVLLLAGALTVLPEKKNPFTALGANGTEQPAQPPQRSIPMAAEAATPEFADNLLVPVRIRAIDTNNQSIRAEIYVDGEPIGAYTPTTLNLAEGPRTVAVLTQEPHASLVSQKVSVRHDKTKSITIEVRQP